MSLRANTVSEAISLFIMRLLTCTRVRRTRALAGSARECRRNKRSSQ
jgi:hypothetical protein